MSPERPEALQVALLVVRLLEALGVRYHLGGSYASSIHGAPRQTQDVDLVADLDATQAEELVKALQPAFYADAEPARRAAEQRSSFNVLHLASGVKVDIFCPSDAPFDRAELERSKAQTLRGLGAEVTIQVKSPEDTILRKLDWYRRGGEVSEQQWRDVVACLRAQEGNLDLEYLHRWADELAVRALLDRALREALANTGPAG